MESNYSVFWTIIANKELELVLEYLEVEFGTSIKYKFLNKVNKCILSIDSKIIKYPIVNKKLNIRKCVIDYHNTLIFRIENDSIIILRLFATKQNPDNLKYLKNQ